MFKNIFSYGTLLDAASVRWSEMGQFGAFIVDGHQFFYFAIPSRFQCHLSS